MNTDRGIESFRIRFVGSGIDPSSVPFRSLATTLQAVQRLAAGVDEFSPTTQPEIDQFALHLVKVTKGSAVYRVAAADPSAVLSRLSRAGIALSDPDKGDDKDLPLSPLADLSAVARKLHCTIDLVGADDDNSVLARILPESYRTVAEHVLVNGETAISGKVVRVGGATSFHCHLRLKAQPRKLLVCRVETPDLVRKLGQHLFQDVTVSGEATWYRRTWQLRTFRIRSMKQLERRPLIESFKALREAGGKAWDKIEDPLKYLREARGE